MKVWDAELLTRKAGNESYITDGLVCWLDGINNTRNGHDATATKWEDLSGYGNDFNLNGQIVLSDKGYVFNGNYNNYFKSEQTYNSAFGTYEAVFKINGSSDTGVFSHQITGGALFVTYNGHMVLSVIARKPYLSNFLSYAVDIGTLSYTLGTTTKAYYNGVQKTLSGSDYYTTDTLGYIYIGCMKVPTVGHPSCPLDGIICAFRLYDRELTGEEIAHNAAIDASRFGGIA